jgi:hypothetical protein
MAFLLYDFYDNSTHTHFYGVRTAIKNIITRYTDFHVVSEWPPKRPKKQTAKPTARVAKPTKYTHDLRNLSLFDGDSNPKCFNKM